jgi:hypothetical protein
MHGKPMKDVDGGETKNVEKPQEKDLFRAVRDKIKEKEQKGDVGPKT